MNDRAQGAIGITRFGLTLIVGAILAWIFAEVALPILSGAKETTNDAQANQATTWLQDFVGYYPFLVLMLAFLGLIVYAVYTREVVGT